LRIALILVHTGLLLGAPLDEHAMVRRLLPDARRLSKHHRTQTVRRLDGRTREARRIKTISADLAAHLGGPERVNPAQRLMIERIAIDTLRLEKLDLKMTAGTFTEHDGRVGHALRNSIRLALRDLGVVRLPPDPPMSADDFLGVRAGRRVEDFLA
jgi:hypothetical protein